MTAGPATIFALTEEHEQLRTSVRAFLEEKSPEEEVRRLMETEAGYDPAVWRQLATMLGLQGLAVPEAYGGSGYSYLEQVIVFEEMGRALLCAPYLSTVALAVNLLLACDDEQAKGKYLPGLAAGEIVGTVAVAEDAVGWDPDRVTLTAEADGAEHRLSGHKMFVPDGAAADLLLVAARTDDGATVLAVDGDAPGLTRVPLETMDLTRKLARLEFDGVSARPVGAPGQAGPVLARTLDLAVVALAAEQVGGAQRCLDMAVDYAKNRVQFGRPIGSFQAIKHKCADMLLEVESARSAAYYAGWCAAEGSDELAVAAPLAKSFCSEAYFHAAAENIQIHGGIGFTWDHPAHLYFRRAKSSQLFLGDPAHHRAVLADRLGM